MCHTPLISLIHRKGSATKLEARSVTEAQVSTGFATGQAPGASSPGLRPSSGCSASGEAPLKKPMLQAPCAPASQTLADYVGFTAFAVRVCNFVSSEHAWHIWAPSYVYALPKMCSYICAMTVWKLLLTPKPLLCCTQCVPYSKMQQLAT